MVLAVRQFWVQFGLSLVPGRVFVLSVVLAQFQCGYSLVLVWFYCCFQFGISAVLVRFQCCCRVVLPQLWSLVLDCFCDVSSSFYCCFRVVLIWFYCGFSIVLVLVLVQCQCEVSVVLVSGLVVVWFSHSLNVVLVLFLLGLVWIQSVYFSGFSLG